MTRYPRSAAVAAVVALGLGAGVTSATAQTQLAQVNSGVSIGPSEALAPPNAPPPAPSEHLFGDWGGLRSELHDIGIDLTLDWTSEVAGNVKGGVRDHAGDRLSSSLILPGAVAIRQYSEERQ